MIKSKISKRQIAVKLVLLLLILAMIPIVIISFYNVPYFDDYNHGYLTHQVINDGFDLIAFLKAAMYQVKDMYFNWQGCYSGIFLSAIHPGVFSESLYGIGSVLLFIVHIVSTMYFSNMLIKKVFKLKYCWIIIGGLIALMQTQYLPSVQEGFFWWSGAVMHTLMFDLMLINISLILRQVIFNKIGFLSVIIILFLLFICGGGGYEIALFIPVFLLAIIVSFVIFNKLNNKKNYRIIWLLFIYFLVSLICLLINVLAPGNAYRIASIGVHVNPIIAILESFIYSGIHFAEYFSIRTIIIILLLFYFIFPKIKNLNFKFIDIKMFTVCMWCLYSVLFTPAIYGENYVASARYLNVLYFASYWFFIIEFLYFFWFYRNNNILNKIHDLLTIFVSKLKTSIFVFGLSFLIATSMMELRYTDSTSVCAFLDIILGNANNYKIQNDNNFMILNSEKSVVEIKKEESIIRVFPQNGSYDKAIIDAMKKYYQKDIITVK